MTDLAATIDALLNLAGPLSNSTSPDPRKRNTFSSAFDTPLKTSGKKSCISEFNYLNSPPKLVEVSFQAPSDSEKPEPETEPQDLLRQVSESQDKILEKANGLLELQTSKTTTRLSETYRTSATEREKSSFYRSSPENSKKKQIETVKRLYQKQEKAKEKIEDMRSREQQKEQEELRFHPQISEKSRNLLVGRRKPLFMRTEEVLKQRKEEIERLKRMRAQENEPHEKELTFKPEILEKDNKEKNKRNIYQDFEEWKKKKAEKIQKMNVEIIKKEVEELTFHPTVNELSRKLAERRKKRGLGERNMNLAEETRENSEKNREDSEKNRENSKKKMSKSRGNTGENKSGSNEKPRKKLWEPKTIRNKENKENLNETAEKTRKKNVVILGEKTKKSAKYQVTSPPSRSLSKNGQNTIKEEQSHKKQKVIIPKPLKTKKEPTEALVNVVRYEPEMDFLLTLLKK